MSKLGTAQEHIRKALDIKLSIESTVCRIQKLNVASITESQHVLAAASHGKQLSVSECWVLVYQACYYVIEKTRMWANAQPDGRPAEHRWCPLFNAQSLADAHYLTAAQ